MSEATKPSEVEATPAMTETVAETKPVTAPTEEAKETTPAETSAEAATEEAAAPAEEAKEVEPIEEGSLEHKGAPAGFPKNLMYTKQHFWFGDDAIPRDKMNAYLKGEKVADVAHHVVSWASHTGKGLLFYGSKAADKSTPGGAIHLAQTSEPTVEGTNKFVITSNGHKHAFKAPTTADRDNWVAQLKIKIAEAKELASAVTESEAYKATLDSLKPTPATPKKDEAAVTEDKPAEAPAAATDATAPAEEVKPTEEGGLEPKEEKKERRSASRKRASIFGNLLGGKKEEKVDTPVTETVAETPAEAPAVEDTTGAADPVETTEAAVPEEVVKEETKPVPTKRTSIFGGFSFGKKKAETPAGPAATPAADDIAETAPVIPAVETTEPLSAEVTSPATAPTETLDATPATNGESKKEMKAEKRKSSLPFVFGKKEKSPTSDEEGEKKSSPLFSKIRSTVKGKAKAAEKTEDKPVETVPEAAKEKADETADKPPVEETPAEKPVVAAPPVTAAA